MKTGKDKNLNNEWIGISEKCPELNKSVLIKTNTDNYYVGYRTDVMARESKQPVFLFHTVAEYLEK